MNAPNPNNPNETYCLLCAKHIDSQSLKRRDGPLVLNNSEKETKLFFVLDNWEKRTHILMGGIIPLPVIAFGDFSPSLVCQDHGKALINYWSPSGFAMKLEAEEVK